MHYYNHKRIKGKLKGTSPVQYRNHSFFVSKFRGSVHKKNFAFLI
ncbi:hypothetical protein CN553_31270 [Bacillus cereus]|uniref:Integrase catalytic domain-containing protein n=1 Tax=Bacillus cereus TaxID=1396 RepID=A0A9X6U5G4_BACCE|nr:hypothetical protein CN553_31270 [Bacillus cereus]